MVWLARPLELQARLENATFPKTAWHFPSRVQPHLPPSFFQTERLWLYSKDEGKPDSHHIPNSPKDLLRTPNPLPTIKLQNVRIWLWLYLWNLLAAFKGLGFCNTKPRDLGVEVSLPSVLCILHGADVGWLPNAHFKLLLTGLIRALLQEHKMGCHKRDFRSYVHFQAFWLQCDQ